MFISLLKNRISFSRYYLCNSYIHRVYYNTENSEVIPDDIFKMRQKMRTLHNIDSSSYSDIQADRDMTLSNQKNVHESVPSNKDKDNLEKCDKIDVDAIKSKYSAKKEADESNDNVMHFNFGTVRLDAANNSRGVNHETYSDIKNELSVSSDAPSLGSRLTKKDDKESNLFGNYNEVSSNGNSDYSDNLFDKEYFGSGEFQNISDSQSSSFDTLNSQFDHSKPSYSDEKFKDQLDIPAEKSFSRVNQNNMNNVSEKKHSEFNEFDQEYFTEQISRKPEKSESENSKLNIFDKEFSNQLNLHTESKSTKPADDIKYKPSSGVNNFNQIDKEYFPEPMSSNSNIRDTFGDFQDQITAKTNSDDFSASNNVKRVKLNVDKQSELNEFDKEYFCQPSNPDNKNALFDPQNKEKEINHSMLESQISSIQNKSNTPDVMMNSELMQRISKENITQDQNSSILINNNKFSNEDVGTKKHVPISENLSPELNERKSLTMLSIAEKKRIERDRANKKKDKGETFTAYDLAIAQRKKDHKKSLL